MYNTIKKYISCFSVTGNENRLADIIAQDMAPYADKITTDPMGNLICFKKGKDSSKRMMFAAHMDEIGFVVTYIEKNGYIRVSNVGGINAVASSSHEVEFINGVKGVLVFESGCTDYNVKKMYVDIGAKDRKEAEKKVSIGTYLALTQRITRLGNRRIAGKAMDDRLGCAVVAEAAKLIKTPAYDTYFVFTTQEEVGLRGAKAAANAILPLYGIACDVTPTYDVIGGASGEVSLGGGAAIKVKDSSVICSKKVVDRLAELAKEKDIKYQYEILIAGGTDTASMQVAGAGCYAGCISVPCRYVHQPVETVDLKDCEAAVKLFAAIAEEGFDK